MPKLTVNDTEVEVPQGATVLQACEEAGVEIPRFCYHERLSIAGNCRMCLVEMERSPKPIASCAMPAGEGMVIRTNTETVKKAREGVLEFLLINHPLDCPICDQGGECDLQDETMAYGCGSNRFDENKRAVSEKHMGPLIKTIMTRCIHCTRCIRFAEEVAGVTELGAIYRGENMQITSYLEKALESELQGNVIDLCPVGALTSKPYAFTARPWELRKTNAIDVMDAVGSNIRIDARGREVMRILPRLNEAINEEWISDKTRFHYDGLNKRRLDKPYVRRDGKLQPASWAQAFDVIADAAQGLDGRQIAGLVGDLNELEGMAALKDLLAKLGSDQIDCAQDGTTYATDSRSAYLFNTGIEGIEQADLCLLIGANPRYDAAILNARILKATRHAGLKVANIGPALDQTYDVEQLGDDAALLNDIYNGSHPFAERLKAAERPMIIIGQGALARSDGAAILSTARHLASNCGAVKEGWNGFNILHTAASRVGALDLGLVNDDLAEKLKTDAIKLLFNLGADETDLSGNSPFTVYLGSHGDRGAHTADIILPAASYAEKDGLYLNLEGRVQESFKAVDPPGDAREDWTILRALSDRLGVTLPYNTLGQLRQRLTDELPYLADLDAKHEAAFEAGPAPTVVEAGPLPLAIADFYLTNPIARASTIMAECSALKQGDGEKGTGTDG